jgi:aspartate/methionine/tyrosine aminotransferase
MSIYQSNNISELRNLEKELTNQYNEFKKQDLKLDLTRGKPSSEQLDLSNEVLNELSIYKSKDGCDCRNYGILDGLPEMKELFSSYLEIPIENIVVGGNSSLTLMADYMLMSYFFGYGDNNKSWSSQGNTKFLCPVPGYDRHFTICERLGIEMINIPMTDTGPDMDLIEKLTKDDLMIKGIWLVPKYSNPTGVTFSDETVERLARMKCAADDFRIMWDNAYAFHSFDTPDKLANIYSLCKKYNNEDRPVVIGSTSKITFAGGGIGFLGISKKNKDAFIKYTAFRTIGPDKLNQLRHIQYLKNQDNLLKIMKKHSSIIKPKFKITLEILDDNLKDTGIAEWSRPKGGYFISFNSQKNHASEIVKLADEAGLKLTPAGATFPYGKDPNDSNIRIAPTFPIKDEIKNAMKLFVICVKLVSVRKRINSLN